MSKSKGNVAYPEPIVKVLGNDALRYYLLREVVFGQDGNFSRDALITRYNADLANGLGNLASRTLTMIRDYRGGVIPAVSERFKATAPSSEWFSPETEANRVRTIERIRSAYENFQFSIATEEIWRIVANWGDQFLAGTRPWVEAQKPGQEWFVDSVLWLAAETLRDVVMLAYPIIPDAAQKIWEQLGQPGKLADQRIDQLKWGELKPGTKIGKPEAVFPRVEKNEAMERIEAMENEIRNPGAAAPAATSSTPAGAAAPAVAGGAGAAAVPAPGAKITIDDFAKVELRVGVVKSAEKIQGADKLLKLMVDIGDEVRQVLAGVALAYAPEQLVGRKVVVVTNLAPRKMRGQESNGMLLAASDGADGKPVLVTFAEEIPVGAKVK
jgi:methionyl-tRNA synthetase